MSSVMIQKSCLIARSAMARTVFSSSIAPVGLHGDEYRMARVRGVMAFSRSARRGTKLSAAAPGTVTGRPPAIFTISL